MKMRDTERNNPNDACNLTCQHTVNETLSSSYFGRKVYLDGHHSKADRNRILELTINNQTSKREMR